MFGSNGFNTLDKKQPGSVIKSFTKRTNYDKKEGFEGVESIYGDIKMNFCKSIVRSSRVDKLHVHSHLTRLGYRIDSNNNIIESLCDTVI